jgi:Ca-activated chloride channel family protein
LQSPDQVVAGAVFSVAWTGPNNDGDFVTIVRKDAADRDSGAYALTKTGNPLELTAPIKAGEWELRYVTARSHTVLDRVPLKVVPADATLEAPAEVTLDTPVTVTWTGPNNVGDYITLVAKEEADGKYGNYALTSTGSSVTITAPPKAGDGELRYMTGQGAKVLGRRPIRIVAPDVSLNAPADAVAGSAVPVTWTGPANPGDYLTVVAVGAKDGLYGNYTTVNKTSPLNVTMPMEPGDAELRYMTGRGAQVLARRPIRVVAAEVSLDAPASAAAGASVSITWTGPNNPSDYLTIVTKGSPDGQYGSYTLTNRGSPLAVSAPKSAGEAEIRYMSGQGAKVIGRRAITITE